jgi:hypothetical protein
VRDQVPPPSVDPAPARPARPVKKVAKKRPAGSTAPSGSSGTKARSAKKRPPAGAAPPPINDAQATTRGAIVIAVTVIVGLLVFWQGFSKESSEIVATGPTTTAVAGPDRDAAPPTTEASQGTTLPSTPVTKVPPDEIKVIVANSVDPSQTIAGPQATKLTDAGYASPVVTMDLPPYGATTSSVYYTGDLESEAQAIAVVLGLPDSAVNPIPTPAPTPMNTAQILVIIGQDAV